MKTELKDVIHLYLGQLALIGNLEKTASITDKIQVFTIDKFNHDKILCRPILRKLTDMKEDEKDEFSEHQIEMFGDDFNTEMYDIEQFLFLLKSGFDLFGLIASGQAIDRNASDGAN